MFTEDRPKRYWVDQRIEQYSRETEFNAYFPDFWLCFALLGAPCTMPSLQLFRCEATSTETIDLSCTSDMSTNSIVQLGRDAKRKMLAEKNAENMKRKHTTSGDSSVAQFETTALFVNILEKKIKYMEKLNVDGSLTEKIMMTTKKLLPTLDEQEILMEERIKAMKADSQSTPTSVSSINSNSCGSGSVALASITQSTPSTPVILRMTEL